MQIVKQLSYGSRERNEVERPDYAAFDPVTALRSVPGCHCKTSALTLVELLVTISIMALVIAISLPMVKPMLESNKTKSGADIVAGFLGQARDRAVEEGRPVGVTFERISDYGDGETYFPYNGASVLMRQVAEPKPLSGFVKDVRVAVGNDGYIYFCTWNGTGWIWPATREAIPNHAEWKYWDKLVNDGDQIQFNGVGPKYEISEDWIDISGTITKLFQIINTPSVNPNLTIPVHFDSSGLPQPALFKVFRKPQATKIAPTMAVPVALPEGIVVDLDCSGMGMRLSDARMMVDGHGGADWTAVRDDFCARDRGDTGSVTIMFSPTGEVDRVYYSSKPEDILNGVPADLGIAIPSGPIYLNIGIWERAGYWDDDGGWHISNQYLPESDYLPNCDMRNFRDMNNYWVTIFPRTGAVRVNRVANTDSVGQGTTRLTNSRKFASSLHAEEVR